VSVKVLFNLVNVLLCSEIRTALQVATRFLSLSVSNELESKNVQEINFLTLYGDRAIIFRSDAKRRGPHRIH
jgi:hypothetical protein